MGQAVRKSNVFHIYFIINPETCGKDIQKNGPSTVKVSDEVAYVSAFDTHSATSYLDSFFPFQIGVRFARQQDPLPYMVSQPLPWQVHSVSHSRRSSKVDEVSCKEI